MGRCYTRGVFLSLNGALANYVIYVYGAGCAGWQMTGSEALGRCNSRGVFLSLNGVLLNYVIFITELAAQGGTGWQM